jgi:nuclear pore complex protein Nup107
MQFGGSALTRDFLMECMDLAALVADEDSDLLGLFMKTGRMQELVEAFAAASKSLLLITSAKQGPASRSKKLRTKGWSQELWNIRQ